MDRRYDHFIGKLSDNPELIREKLYQKGNGDQTFLESLPPSCFINIWKPQMRKKGFYQSLTEVKESISSFITSLIFQRSPKRLIQSVIGRILPEVILYEIDISNTQEILKRVIALKSKWNLKDQFCGHLVGFLQKNSFEDKQNIQKQQKLLNDILVLFEIVESKVNYYSYAIEILNQGIGKALFLIGQNLFSFEQIYKKLIATNRNKIIFLLSKLKNRIKTFGQILSSICQLENNQDCLSQIKNIIILFLLFDYWHLFKEENSQLKQSIVIQTFALSFHRLMYLLYNLKEKVTNNFLWLLKNSNVDHYEEIQNKISFHLLGLFKLTKLLEKEKINNLILIVWKQKMKGLKINQFYLESSQVLVSQSQKISKTIVIQQQYSSSHHFKQSQQLKSIRGSRSKPVKIKEDRHRYLRAWIYTIEKDLKNFQIQKIFLLLQGLRRFYRWQYVQKNIQEDERPNVRILNLVTTIMKQLTEKIKFRYNCSLLQKSIKWELAQLTYLCETIKFTYEEASENLGLFQYCSVQNNFFRVEQIIQIHSQFNFQESIYDIMNIKLLQQELNSNIFKGMMDNYEQQFKDNSFETRLFTILKKMNKQNNKVQSKKMYILTKLLSLKNKNITNNLLANFSYHLFFNQKIQEKLSQNLIEYSRLLNDEIINEKDQDRIKILLQMGSIFQKFDQKKIERSECSMGSQSTARKYFLFLRHNFHKSFFLKYSKIYQKFNYLKEAIHFLQLFYLRHPQITADLQAKLTVIEIYQRLSPSFSKNIKYITAEQNMQYQFKKNNLVNANHFINQLVNSVILILRNQISSNINPYHIICINGFPKMSSWLVFYDPIVSFFNETISKLKVSEQIRQNLFLFNIMTIFITIKANQVKEGNEQQTIKILTSKVGHLNEKTQILLYRILLEEIKLGILINQVQNKYLQLLLKYKESEQLQKYLNSMKCKNNFQERYLRFIIKDNFQNKKYLDCLAKIKILQEKRDLPNQAQLYQLELQCQYKVMLNFSIQNFLQFLDRKCITSPNNNIAKEKHFGFYFKIFRFLFQRYNFTQIHHNQHFLLSYFKFIDKNAILTQNKHYISETIFYLLRFILQKFNYYEPESQNYGILILSKFKGCYNQFIPFCDYLLKRISTNKEKNEIIQTILVTVISQYPKECIWIICFLKNFNFKSIPKTDLSPQDEQQIIVIESVIKNILEQLQKTKALNKDHLAYIDSMTSFGYMSSQQKKYALESFKELKIPKDLSYMFDPQYNIHKIRQAHILGNGKSVPIELKIILFHPGNGCYKEVRLIIKSNYGCKKYRIQSNTANFFYQIGLIDKDITYRIFHLSKFLVLIEYVQSCGTINHLIQHYCPQFKKVLLKIDVEFKQREKNQKGKSQKRMLEIYDNFASKIKIPISQILILMNKNIKNVNQWWASYTNFVKTNAQWSFLCYIVGLGDRHMDNILMTEKGKLIHIDVEYALDSGLKLPYPQWVPFRLTNSLIEPLGILGVFGLYYAEMISISKEFQQQQANIWKALSHFARFFQTNLTLQIINRSKFQNYGVRCIQQGISHIIKCAKNPELLRLMYVGWRAYI